MPDDLASLESQRSMLLEEFLGLGDLRPGSITAVTRRCGNVNLCALWFAVVSLPDASYGGTSC